MVNVAVGTKAVPPVATVYHCKAVPIATKFATVAELQKVCADAVGGEGGEASVPVAKVIVVLFVPL